MRGRVVDMDEEGLGILENGIRVPFTVVGDHVEVHRTVNRFGKVLAKEFKVLEKSSLRQRPRCVHVGRCGGCLWGHVKYGEQLRLKRELFERITGISAEIKGSPKVWSFRSVSNFIVTIRGMGLKEFGDPRTVVNLRECPVFSSRTPQYLHTLRAFLKETGLRPWGPKGGDVHYLQVREGKFTGDIMINIIAHGEAKPEVLEAFRNYFSFASSLYWSIKADERDDPKGEPLHVGGEPYIRERILGVTYLIHPASFFQTNSYALPLLLKAVEGFIDGSRVLDLYSGVGTFGVYLAKRGFEVEGVEINPFAVEMANRNAKINDVQAEFKVGRAEDVLIGSYDTVIVDPPRKGLKDGAKRLMKGPARIVYVSCNPRAFKLDYERHLSKVYRIEDVILIDMFPHTPHVEAVVKLVRKF
ncbi:23S rRNA (uracil(1939)-C(5))-methyltransferase RlmD [Pyrococcus yayanosii]|uniref:23S rRNA (Uracil-5-)-methyltransferase (RumA) n=1 Tax=Pyrococcus yayanosii (strain CH1 / JCM 16557) TaxID=529709 RepID=F8AF55_PYRYC|nr:23S rRNA (uracil(1939)-C(5))-methyltransferase RlmD [Pyrococcus yayanosii]AEH23729.1 23S rRNA (uracil-5-)-methyltransferase (rumA) [Pyrococcus yayanosii CH1]